LDQLVAESLRALAIEVSFGQSVAVGYAELIGEVPSAALEAYRSSLRHAGDTGPTSWAASWRSACRRFGQWRRRDP
jgi:hypothetical protein